jgi:hypothetical protein
MGYPIEGEAVRTTEFVLTEVEAVLAGTLALMTAMAQGCCADHRRAIRQKVIENLAELEQNAQLSDQFRAVASHLQQHWYALGAEHRPQGGEAPHWHTPPGMVQ